MLQPGARVRHAYSDITGTIVRRYHGRGEDWLVRWDSGREITAHSSNLEEIELPRSATEDTNADG